MEDSKHHITIKEEFCEIDVNEMNQYEYDITYKEEENILPKNNVKTKPVNEKKKHPCPLCDMCFSFSSGLRYHVEGVHEKKRPQKCSQCSKSFKATGALNRHILSVHLNINHLNCEVC